MFIDVGTGAFTSGRPFSRVLSVSITITVCIYIKFFQVSVPRWRDRDLHVRDYGFTMFGQAREIYSVYNVPFYCPLISG